MAESHATVRVNEAKRQAIKSRESHFAALELFVTRELDVFLKQCPDYALFPGEYAAVERTNWYREQLMKVWAGRDPAGIRLMILLGLRRQPNWSDYKVLLGGKRISTEDMPEEVRLDPTFAVDAISWTEIVLKLKQELGEVQFIEENGYPVIAHIDPKDFESFGLPEAKVAVGWQRAEIQCDFKTKFQAAIFCLMQDSWRAKICPNCGAYFVADKSARTHCSHECYVEKKNERSLVYWKRKGKAKRLARTKREKR